MKPFLHISVRDHDGAAEAEFLTLLALTGLPSDKLVQVRAEQAPLPLIDPDDFAGVIIGGGQFNASDEVKSATQLRVETDLGHLVEASLAGGVPLLGLCYGLGVVTSHLGGVVDRRYGEGAGAVAVTLTEAGLADPLFEGLSPSFRAFTGHKEACSVLPEGAVVLASGTACPVQAFRVGESVYVTQFHPELDAERLIARMGIYADAGYFDPDDFDALSASARAADVGDQAALILANFVARFAQP